MLVLDRRNFLALTSGALTVSGLALPARAAVAEASVFTSDEAGALVDSTVILGEAKALLVDAQLNVPNATALADVIAATGRELETIWITHFHPDHLLGLAVLMDRFPAAKPLTHPAIRPVMEATAQGILDFFGSQFPGAFAGRVVLPDAHDGNRLMLEGEEIEIIGPLHGDTALVTALHVPSLSTLIASDLLYTDTHVWLEENTKPEALAQWRKSLDLLEGLQAKVIIPGHRVVTSVNDASSFAHTRGYLDQWEAALATTKTADELRAAMMAGRESLGLTFALDRAVAAVYPG